MQGDNRALIFILLALAVAQVITFMRLNELEEKADALVGANNALFECVRLQAEIDAILNLKRPHVPQEPEIIYPKKLIFD